MLRLPDPRQVIDRVNSPHDRVRVIGLAWLIDQVNCQHALGSEIDREWATDLALVIDPAWGNCLRTGLVGSRIVRDATTGVTIEGTRFGTMSAIIRPAGISGRTTRIGLSAVGIDRIVGQPGRP